jgi:hypothetical protein
LQPTPGGIAGEKIPKSFVLRRGKVRAAAGARKSAPASWRARALTARLRAFRPSVAPPPRRPQVGKLVKELVKDFRQMVMPHTAAHLKERK